MFPEGFKPTGDIKSLNEIVLPDVDQKKEAGFADKFKKIFG